MTQTNYNDPRGVQEEVEWSRQLFAKLRCPVLDVTDQAIEEQRRKFWICWALVSLFMPRRSFVMKHNSQIMSADRQFYAASPWRCTSCQHI